MRRAARWLAGVSVGTGKVSAPYKAHRFLRAWGLPAAVAHATWNGSWLPGEISHLMARDMRSGQPVEAAIQGLISRSDLPLSPDLRALQIVDMLEYLPHDILTKVDRVTMRHGLESRAPFLNPSVAEFGVALSPGEKVVLNGKPKRILRALAERTFPKEITGAKKQGFSIPVHDWLRGEMRDALEAYLSRERLRLLPFLDADAVVAHKERHIAKVCDLGFELWGLMSLSAWWGHHADPVHANLQTGDLVRIDPQSATASSKSVRRLMA